MGVFDSLLGNPTIAGIGAGIVGHQKNQAALAESRERVLTSREAREELARQNAEKKANREWLSGYQATMNKNRKDDGTYDVEALRAWTEDVTNQNISEELRIRIPTFLDQLESKNRQVAQDGRAKVDQAIQETGVVYDSLKAAAINIIDIDDDTTPVTLEMARQAVAEAKASGVGSIDRAGKSLTADLLGAGDDERLANDLVKWAKDEKKRRHAAERAGMSAQERLERQYRQRINFVSARVMNNLRLAVPAGDDADKKRWMDMAARADRAVATRADGYESAYTDVMSNANLLGISWEDIASAYTGVWNGLDPSQRENPLSPGTEIDIDVIIPFDAAKQVSPSDKSGRKTLPLTKPSSTLDGAPTDPGVPEQDSGSSSFLAEAEAKAQEAKAVERDFATRGANVQPPMSAVEYARAALKADSEGKLKLTGIQKQVAVMLIQRSDSNAFESRR